jgi:hypothetical protein
VACLGGEETALSSGAITSRLALISHLSEISGWLRANKGSLHYQTAKFQFNTPNYEHETNNIHKSYGTD